MREILYQWCKDLKIKEYCFSYLFETNHYWNFINFKMFLQLGKNGVIKLQNYTHTEICQFSFHKEKVIAFLW